MDYLMIIFCVICFFIGVYFGKRERVEKTTPRKRAKANSSLDKAAQKRVVAEMQNFLNYDGNKQEDIL